MVCVFNFVEPEVTALVFIFPMTLEEKAFANSFLPHLLLLLLIYVFQ